MKNKNKKIMLLLALLGIITLAIQHVAAQVKSLDANTTLDTKNDVQNEIEAIRGQVSQTIRFVTAYNTVEAQTDDTPCIAASNQDICKLLDQGQKICAANFVPIDTKLYIQNYGECIVLDRMNSKYPNRVDIAMSADQLERAQNFGKQKLLVTILSD